MTVIRSTMLLLFWGSSMVGCELIIGQDTRHLAATADADTDAADDDATHVGDEPAPDTATGQDGDVQDPGDDAGCASPCVLAASTCSAACASAEVTCLAQCTGNGCAHMCSGMQSQCDMQCQMSCQMCASPYHCAGPSPCTPVPGG